MFDWIVPALNISPTILSIIVICLVSAIGLQLGKLKLFNISLGITFVFFTGIVVGHFRLPLERETLQFAQNFGLIIFVYALGLQVGPGFISSFRKEGLTLNLLSLAIIFIGLVMTLVFSLTTNVSLPNMIGILCGAVTNTPALGAAQQALSQITGTNSREISDMAMATAVTYPLGVVGVILAIVFLRSFFVKPEDLQEDPDEKAEHETYVGEFMIANPAIDGMTIRDITKQSAKKFVISRIWQDGKVIIPAPDSVLKYGDHLLVVSFKSDVSHLKLLFGKQENKDWNKEDIDWNNIDNSQLVSRRILVTRSKVNGMKLATLRLRNTYGINITRINRAGVELIPSNDLTLQIGDRLTVVGEKASIDNVSKILGNEVKRLKSPNLIAIFVGITIGLLLGSLPLPLPGMDFPVRLGIAGGPIIVGILMSTIGPRFHFTTYTTQSSNILMRQFGLTFYLACLGISSGEHFLETVMHGSGLQWIGIGFILTAVPVLIVAFIAMKVMHVKFAKNVGMFCGSMANPMALSYMNSTADGDAPSVAYATVYPVAMFSRIILTQMLLMLFY
ncbi:MAG: putative transporter [Dysgonamonadaceae bacterium]